MSRIWGVVAAAAAGALLSFRPIYEPDLWWHLAQGRETLDGRLVRTNVFSFNYADYRQHYTSWLFDVSAYGAWMAAGPVGIQLLQTALLALTLILICVACRVRAPAWSAGVVLILGFFVLEPRAIPRPHLVSFAGLAACAWLVEQAALRGSVTPLILSVPLVAAWSNFHVECVFGVLLVGIFAAGEWVRPGSLTRAQASRALAVAALAAVATLANPYGMGLAAYLHENWSVPGILTIAELEPAPWPAYRAFYAYVALCAGLMAWQWKTARVWEVCTAIVFAAAGARFLRLTPLVLLATAPIVARRLASLAPTARPLVPIGSALVAGILLSRIPPLLLVTSMAAGADAVEPPLFFSPGAVRFARERGLAGPVFNSHNLGGYLAWTLYPSVRTFQDSRLQAYPPEHFLSILVASRTPADWEVLVADVDWAIVSLARPNQLSGVGQFRPPDWGSVYRDEAVEIMVRRRRSSLVGSPAVVPLNKDPTTNDQRPTTND
jgi:hypothetical protein